MAIEHYHKTADLPATIPVFPLSGALLFPRWSLPLNIFEPRYLNMIDDAMAGTRIIGMIQTMAGPASAPELAHVGCAGRLTSYSETDDGRYLISLTGICRFRIVEELSVDTPYRQVVPDWTPYASDLEPDESGGGDDRLRLTNSLKRYTHVNNMEVDWDAVENAAMETLINALSAGCPFGAMEKQALLEAGTVAARAETLITLLDMDVPGDDTSTLQ
ncbi:MAG: LON peptidase substrate-binding domain-containing protein [Henriciella sp.]|nr:LON peptidase substrate-binding domain-containing protein [Henriciella sp.]